MDYEYFENLGISKNEIDQVTEKVNVNYFLNKADLLISEVMEEFLEDRFDPESTFEALKEISYTLAGIKVFLKASSLQRSDPGDLLKGRRKEKGRSDV